MNPIEIKPPHHHFRSEENLWELPEELRLELSSLGAWVTDGVLAGDRRDSRTEWRAGREEILESEGVLLMRDRRSREEEEEGMREVEQLTDNMRLTARDLAEEEEERLPLTTDSARLEACVAPLS